MAVNIIKGTMTPKRNHILVVVVACLLMTITVLVVFGFYVVEKSQTTVSPLKKAVHHMQIELDEVHQWVQNMLAAHTKSNTGYVWFQLDLSVGNLRKMLAANHAVPQASIPAELNKQLILNLKDLDADIAAYKMAVARILDPDALPEKSLDSEVDYEQAYNAIQTRLVEMESPIDIFLQKDLLFFRKLMVGGVVTCLLLVVMIAITLGRFLKQKTADYTALNEMHENLKREFRERSRAEESLRQSELLFRTVFETSPDAIVITRIADNAIIDVNFGFTAYSGFDREEVVGRSVYDIELWQDPEQRKVLLDKVNEKGSAGYWEAVLRTKQAGFITCLLSTKQIEIDGEPHILTVARDISDRIRYEKRIQAANRFLYIGNRHTKMRPLLKEFVEEIKKVSGCSATAVRIVDEEGKIPYVGSDGFNGDFCSIDDPLSVYSEKGMCIRVIKDQKGPLAPLFTTYGSYFTNSTSAFLSSASEDQKRLMRNTCHRFGYETIALIPIRSGERTIGLIHVADRETDRLDSQKIEMLEFAALQLGTAIERVQAEQGLRDSHDELEKQVDKRTSLLLRAKNDLLAEVEQRKIYEQELLGLQQRLRELSSRLIQAEALERRRIATEIHDRIGQTLAVIKMQLGSIQADFDFQDLKKRIDFVRDMVSQTIGDVRSLTFELSPPILYELGLKAALEWLAESLRKQSGLQVEVVALGGSDRMLDADRRGLLFRTCSELLLNVVKHAQAEHARVTIHIESDLVRAEISDDGLGFDPVLLHEGFDPSERGFGLFSIREQLQHYCGMFEIDSSPNQGSMVKIELPLSMTSQPEARELS
jgi:PAS domain S-box-containing protein